MSLSPSSSLHLSERHFRSIAELIEGHVGIRLPPGKRSMIEGRLQKRVRLLECGGVNDYVEQLFDEKNFDRELVHLIDCVTTNKTDFFREPAHFDYLRNVAVPELLEARGRGKHRLKIWSAACSTGMEAYTIAMVLADMTQTNPRFDFSILGTDISTRVLALADDGIYTQEMVAPIPPQMAKQYLMMSRNPQAPEVRIVPELRSRTQFMRLNLMDPTYPIDRDVDVIFCRNVLIYFEKAMQRKIVERLSGHLRHGGYLMVGHSESMVYDGKVGLKQVHPTIFRV